MKAFLKMCHQTVIYKMDPEMRQPKGQAAPMAADPTALSTSSKKVQVHQVRRKLVDENVKVKDR